MKTILICPNNRPALAQLAENIPLVNIPLLGETFLIYWLEHLSASGIKEVRLLVSDSAAEVERMIQGGSRWGLSVEVLSEVRQLTPKEARKRYRPSYENDWAAEPHDVIVADHLPGKEGEALFASYESWFNGVLEWVPNVIRSTRIMRELKPGVWVGRRTEISRSAKIEGPCWMGDHVRVGPHCLIGPGTILENNVVVDKASEIKSSWVGPDTYVGQLVHIHESLAWGANLINWKSGSHIIVPDSFLLSSLVSHRNSSLMPEKISSVVQESFPRTIDLLASVRAKLQG
ncbi:MAG: hypothetical protein SFY81_07455 [Verrucomicrobiota bacterium]|nr:hypothetical protein [Verrucomicrobiota bacterium]